MTDKVYPTDVLRSVDRMVDTMKAYYDTQDSHSPAVYARLVGMLSGTIMSISWDLPQDARKKLIDDFEKQTQDYMHKLTLETLRAKETA